MSMRETILVAVLVGRAGCGLDGSAVPPVDDASASPAPAALLAHVERAPQLAAGWPCPPDPTGICADDVGDYLALARSLSPEVDFAACAADLKVELADEFWRRQDDHPEPMHHSNDEFPDVVTELLGVESWMEDIAASPPRVLLVGEEQLPTHRRLHLFIEAPRLGRVPAILALPNRSYAAEQRPVVLGLPGHGWTGREFLAEYGPELLGRGIAVLALTFRAYGADRFESDATLAMLCAGKSMALVRNVEALSALQWLDALSDEGEFTAVGLMGHSGGAVMANLLQWYAPVDAVASDFTSELFDVAPGPEPGAPARFVLDETHPELSRRKCSVINYEMSPVPVLSAPYGYNLDPEHSNGGAPQFGQFFEELLYR